MTDQESLRINRLETLLKALNISQKLFAQKTKINYGYVSHLLSGYRPISLSTIYKIKSAFPQVNERWMSIGEGEMFLDSDSEVVVQEPGYQYRSDVIGDPLAELRQLLDRYGREIELLKEDVRRLKEEIIHSKK